MKKVKLLYLFCLSLAVITTGCMSQGVVSGTIKKDDFAYEHQDNALSNTFITFNYMVDTKKGMIFLPSFYDTQKTAMMFGNKDLSSFKMISANPSKSCSYDNYQNCDTTIEDASTSRYQAYGDYIYYVKQIMNEETEVYEDKLFRMNFDGQNREELFTFHLTAKEMEKEITLYYAIHQNYLYYVHSVRGIRRINMENFKEDESFHLSDNSRVLGMYFHNDSLIYITNSNDIENTSNSGAQIIQYNLKTNKSEVILEKVGLLFADENNIFYLKDNEEAIYLYNRKTKVSSKIFDTYISGRFRYKDYYVMDTCLSIDEEEGSNIYLVGLDGTILDHIKAPFNNEYVYTQGIFDEKLFAYSEDNNKLYYYEIKDGKFSSLHEVKFE